MPLRPGNAASTDAERADLERLADELGVHGCKTVLVTRDGCPPYLDVLNPGAPRLTERVYAQAGSFWWPWAEAITGRDQPATAAQAIARALRVTGRRL